MLAYWDRRVQQLFYKKRAIVFKSEHDGWAAYTKVK